MTTNLKPFRAIYEGTKEGFIQSGKLTADEKELLVFITGDGSEGSSCIYAQGTFFADFKTLIASLAFVKGVNIGGVDYDAALGGGRLKFSAADPATVVYVENDGIKIGLSAGFVTKVNDTATQLATVMGDYLTSADRTALEGLIATAKSETKSEAVAAVVGNSETDTKDSKTIEGVRKYVDAKTSDIASNTDFSTLKGRVDVIEGDYLKNADKEALQGAIDNEKSRIDGIVADYLKASDKEELANSVKAISDDYLKAADKTELANRITNEAPVTMSEAAGSGDVLKVYTFTQNGKEIGKINIARDLVVTGGTIVEKEGVKYLQLSIANQSEPVEIAVSDLVDVYTAGDYVTIGSDNKISVNKAAIIEGLATDANAQGYATAAKEAAIADADAKLANKANAADVYTKTKADELLGAKANSSDVYGKSEVYTKSEANNELAKKANASDVYTKTEADELLSHKAAVGASYTKSEADALFNNKANSADVYTKTETYSKAEVDAMFAWVKL